MNAIRFCVRQPPAPRSAKKKLLARPVPKQPPAPLLKLILHRNARKQFNDLKNEIGGIAVDIAGKVVEREINEADHQALIDEFIRNVGDAS